MCAWVLGIYNVCAWVLGIYNVLRVYWNLRLGYEVGVGDGDGGWEGGNVIGYSEYKDWRVNSNSRGERYKGM